MVGAVSLAILQLQTNVGSSLSEASELAVTMILAGAAVTFLTVVIRIPYYMFFGKPRGADASPRPDGASAHRRRARRRSG